MNNWTIGKRVTLGFASVLAILAVMAATSFVLLKQIKTHQDGILGDALPGITASGQIKYLACDAELNMLRMMNSKSVAEQKIFEDNLKADLDQNTKNLDDYEKTIVRSDDREQFNRVVAARKAWAETREPVLDAIRAVNDAEVKRLNPALREAYTAYLKECDGLFEENSKYGEEAGAASQKAMLLANALTTVLAITGILLGILLAHLVVRGVNRVLTGLSKALDDGSSQVASAAGQVSSASQTLAEGASEQASSLEETSSSLEEMASMTKRNAENAQTANDLAKKARQAADKGAADMQTMNAAMEAIKTSSDDIAKIIKTIDEIAFQTNILALNAAVEAARAGEAGMGFAVVADEVRNLAQRSAQAAKETAAKIEGAISKTAQGVGISKQVASALNLIVTQIRQVDELAAEVAGASREQTQGITQINTAVGQMDKVTQSNAASAEESAAAAEELNAQAEAMRESVRKLLELVGGTGQVPTAKIPHASGTKHLHATAPAAKRPAAASQNGKSNGDNHTVPVMTTAAHRGSEIPMEGEFNNF